MVASKLEGGALEEENGRRSKIRFARRRTERWSEFYRSLRRLGGNLELSYEAWIAHNSQRHVRSRPYEATSIVLGGAGCLASTCR